MRQDDSMHMVSETSVFGLKPPCLPMMDAIVQQDITWHDIFRRQSSYIASSLMDVFDHSSEAGSSLSSTAGSCIHIICWGERHAPRYSHGPRRLMQGLTTPCILWAGPFRVRCLIMASVSQCLPRCSSLARRWAHSFPDVCVSGPASDAPLFRGAGSISGGGSCIPPDPASSGETRRASGTRVTGRGAGLGAPVACKHLAPAGSPAQHQYAGCAPGCPLGFLEGPSCREGWRHPRERARRRRFADFRPPPGIRGGPSGHVRCYVPQVRCPSLWLAAGGPVGCVTLV
jgi:hypothetical protein